MKRFILIWLIFITFRPVFAQGWECETLLSIEETHGDQNMVGGLTVSEYLSLFTLINDCGVTQEDLVFKSTEYGAEGIIDPFTLEKGLYTYTFERGEWHILTDVKITPDHCIVDEWQVFRYDVGFLEVTTSCTLWISVSNNPTGASWEIEVIP